ncbi:MAG: DegT/DnrJ/EryC1/StrS family aminotransferase [Magnetococcales bacterium]|nr:DegT/DnrJ/EryC1/StrS family aminotransferase [Magnetococcales bacterium]
MMVPFLDLRVTDVSEREELLQAVNGVLSHGRIVLGPEVELLEEQVARECDRRYAVGVNSGSDALILSLRSLALPPGSEIITTPLSFIATANAIRLNGLVPVFADIGDDLNLDPESIAGLITPRTKAIMVVHWAGKLCAMDAIATIAKERGLIVIEDASQAYGASMGERKAGGFGLLGCFSMNSMKVLASLGEAGMVVTDDLELRDRLIALRYNGLVNREECHYVSHNGRLDTIQAAMLLVRLRRFASVIDARRNNASFYREHLKERVICPEETPGFRDVFYAYTIRSDRRDDLKRYLENRGIETKIQHPFLMPQHPAYRGSPGRYPNAERLVRMVLSLPVHEKLTFDQRHRVVDAVQGFFAA